MQIKPWHFNNDPPVNGPDNIYHLYESYVLDLSRRASRLANPNGITIGLPAAERFLTPSSWRGLRTTEA